MDDIRKEQEDDELHRTILSIADELRGSVDGWDFKSYVLGTMFYRYISENLTEYINAEEAAAGNNSFDYARLSDADLTFIMHPACGKRHGGYRLLSRHHVPERRRKENTAISD